VHAVHVIGYSVDHRPIVAILIASGRASRSMLVVGSIAGDEPGSTTVTRALESLPAVRGLRLWLIPNMNPDGAVRGTRVNADGVDLNRNFPFAWRPFSDRDSRYFPGRRPASEPESQAVAAFITRLRPGLTIWLHQPYGVIDDSQGPRWAEQLLSRATGLPLERINDYPGSAIGWEDHLIPRSAFDLELPGPPLTPPRIRRYVDAIRLLARTYATRR
jgi:protein MpaA